MSQQDLTQNVTTHQTPKAKNPSKFVYIIAKQILLQFDEIFSTQNL